MKKGTILFIQTGGTIDSKFDPYKVDKNKLEARFEEI